MKPKYFKINYPNNKVEYYIAFSDDSSYYFYNYYGYHWYESYGRTWAERCHWRTPIEVSPLEIILVHGIKAFKEGEAIKVDRLG